MTRGVLQTVELEATFDQAVPYLILSGQEVYRCTTILPRQNDWRIV
jgi:hypothetical protein